LNNLGRFANKLPSEPRENIVYQCWERFCQELGKTVPVAMTLEKNMPIGSGLGSSACSVVAALVAMNEHCGKPLNDTRLLAIMGELEGRISGSIHYDNVAPCFLGGMLFDWNYREPLLFLACLFAGMVLLGIFRIIELLEQR
ncbi:MAG: hypothetical protein KH811_10760, partial [Veillonella sp.]|nr:hypothetical protein [Veillonella sp.]